MIEQDPDKAREFFIHLRLKNSFKFYLYIFIGMKFLINIFEKLRSYSKVYFLLDLILCSILVLGLFFIIDEKKFYTTDSPNHFIVIMCYLFFINSVMYFVVTFYNDDKKVYNHYIGIFVMLTATLASSYILREYKF